ncbi:MAG: Eco57I restriction-modification methylase domain-containing protein [Ruminococcus sp.]|nr:Eco57I restriction-modification methylase domain-containing protein [Ruminococcus sp.]
MADIYNTMYNPDVLSCIANLSNDEVFTPPSVANAMLDLLPQELFSDPDTRFLDPACKSGVFLREIAKRLLKGLEPIYPDLQERTDHIFKNQLYGIAITELTSHLSRRSLYCSKTANGNYSVVHFDTVDGNVRFKNIQHRWQNGKCVYCGTSKTGDLGKDERGLELEAHAYELIHTSKPEEIFKMKFDVIISNPPYQLNTAGDDNGAQAKPIYQLFVKQAIKLAPRYLVMITPSRWFAGGWGLDDFRNEMIHSNHLRIIHDYQNSSDCFSGVEIKGGVSYFLYDRDNEGTCEFISHESDKVVSTVNRYLHEDGCEVLIRYNELISIYRKARARNKFEPFSSIVSGRSPFGLNTNHYGNPYKHHSTDVEYFERKGLNYMDRSRVTKNTDAISKWKLYIAKTAEDGKLPGKVIGNITDGKPGSICSGTYLMIGPFDTETEMNNVKSYMQTKFFRILVAANKISQDAYAKVYDGVPMQDFSKPWTDEELYAKYNLTDEEIAFIESMIKPMD